jgi:hypothetical protein
VRRWFGVVIGLKLDDTAADPIHEHGRTDEIGRYVEDASAEKGSSQALRHRP